MDDKQRRRAARRKKKSRRGLKPLNIAKGLNTYVALRRMFEADTAVANNMEVAIQSDENLVDAIVAAQDLNERKQMLLALDKTLDHFQIVPEKRDVIGDILLRFSMFMAEQDQRITIDPNVKTLDILADLYEYYQIALNEESP